MYKKSLLSERLTDARTLKENGISDFAQIDKIITDLGKEKVFDRIIAAPIQENYSRFISKYVKPACEGFYVPALKDITFRDLIGMCNCLMKEDVEDFLLCPNSFDLPDFRTDLDQMSFTLDYFFNIFSPYKSTRIGPNGCMLLKDFMNIRYTSFRDYMQVNYQYTLSCPFSKEDIKPLLDNTGMTYEEYIDSLCLRDFIDIINTHINRKWIPFHSVTKFISEIRLGYTQINEMFFYPLSIIYFGKTKASWLTYLPGPVDYIVKPIKPNKTTQKINYTKGANP